MGKELPKYCPGLPQQGFIVLVMVIVLLTVATITTLMVGRVALIEQKIVGTDVRNKEIYSAVSGGLEYGVNWFEQNHGELIWSDADHDGVSCANDTAAPKAYGQTQLNADSYTHNISYRLKNCLDGHPVVITVESMASAVNDSHIRKTVAIDVMVGLINELFSPSVTGAKPSEFNGPPVMVEGCMGGVKGNPNIYPNTELGIAIGTTTGTINCIDQGHFNLNGGTKKALLPSMSLAESIFGVVVPSYTDGNDKYEREEVAVKAKLLQQEASHPSQVFVVDGSYPRFPADQPGWNGINWHNSLGSADKPVILYFDRSVGCPKINGAPVIHGLIYFADNDCATHGWGNGQIHGTVALRGNMTSHTANTKIHGKPLDFGGAHHEEAHRSFRSPGLGEEYKIAEIPGSWRDFDPSN